MFLNLLIPSTLVLFSTRIIQVYFNQSFFKSAFLSNNIIMLYYYLILKFDIFKFGNIFFISLILLLLFFEKKKIKPKIKEILFFISSIYLIHLFSKNFYLYKYDEFSEYGIITKLIFFINTLPINDTSIWGKGTYEKINLLSSFYIFFLKNNFLDYNENILIFSNIFYIITLALYIISEFKNLSTTKKIFSFLTLVIFTYMLNSGLDRIYPETILSLLLCLIFIKIDKLNNKFNKLDFFIILLSLFIIFCIKYNGIIISTLTGFFLIINLFLIKKYKAIISVVLILLFSVIFLKLHTIPIKFSAITFNQKIDNKILEKDVRNFKNTYALIPESLMKNKKITPEKILNSVWTSNKNESIYHLYSFSALNNLLSILKINFKLPNIGLNFFCWALILLILYVLDKKYFLKENFFYLFIIIFILIIYQTILAIWALQQNLVNEDGSLLISWSRHLGIIINGFFSFYFLKILSDSNSKKGKLLLFCLIIFIFIFIPTRTFRGITHQVIEKKIPFWQNKIELRENIKNLADKIKNISEEEYFFLIVLENNELDPYFYPILKYELIKTNIIVIGDNKLLKEIIRTIRTISQSAQKYYILSYKDSSNTKKNFYKEKNINFDFFELNKIK